ncbi:MAG: glutathione S-transferase [Alphaproteobacteria bacterium]|nr:glutathione S-transferase [Alphaproteobacteria bacterium]
MILRSAPASPFGRKVKMAAHIVGVIDRIKVVNADTLSAEDDLRQQNPLGKIPTLILDDGRVIYDSRVIVEYIDHLDGGGRVIPVKSPDRFDVLVMQSLADGIMDAAILQIYELRFRTEDRREQKWVSHQAGKVERALAALEANPPHLSPVPHIGTVAVACALGYLDFRFEGAWRKQHPRLVAWLDDFAARVPSFATTAPH